MPTEDDIRAALMATRTGQLRELSIAMGGFWDALLEAIPFTTRPANIQEQRRRERDEWLDAEVREYVRYAGVQDSEGTDES